MRCMRVVAVLAAGLLLMIGWPLPALAQDEPSAEEPTADTDDTTVGEEETKKKKFPFALYLYAGAGAVDMDPLNTSLQTTIDHLSDNTLTFTELPYYKTSIGWKLRGGKGDFRLNYSGFREDGYDYLGLGRSATLPVDSGFGNTIVLQVLDWWTVNIADGVLVAEKNPPRWDLDDDTNGDMSVSRDEVTQGGPTDPFYVLNTRQVPEDLGNTTQHVDLVYGREWGGRRFSGRWWGGLRYYNYEGNVLGGAWLNTAVAGNGYTDGSTMRLLNFFQEASGGGPTVAIEADYNFFDKRLTFYVGAQSAFVLLDLTVDTGEFFTLVDPQDVIGATDVSHPVEARLTETRAKSTWQNAGELGVRVTLKSGIELDLAYHIQGYLDVLLMPSRIQIPETTNQARDCGNDPELQACTTGIYQTQDLVMDGWRFGVGFQF